MLLFFKNTYTVLLISTHLAAALLIFLFFLFTPLALRRLRGCDVQNCELDEILQEQAETRGMRPSRPWELFTDRSVRWQLITVMIISSAMQLCGNDSVRTPCVNIYQGDVRRGPGGSAVMQPMRICAVDTGIQ